MSIPFSIESKATAITAMSEVLEAKYGRLVSEGEFVSPAQDECSRLIYSIMTIAESLASDVQALVTNLDFCSAMCRIEKN